MEPFNPPPQADVKIDRPKTRNSEQLESFVAYCKANSQLRFWQALLNWSQLGFIVHTNAPVYEINRALKQSGIAADIVVEDTYYWEGRNS